MWKWLSINRYSEQDEAGKTTDTNYRVRVFHLYETLSLTSITGRF